MYKISDNLTTSILQNQQQIEKYNRKEIDSNQLKAGNTKIGVYEQRNDGNFMLRLRSVGGLITPAQLKRVAEAAKKFNASHIHITTRQELQLHGLNINDLSEAMFFVKEAGLSSLGGGGNTVRNFLVNEQAGISKQQTFDPYPYAIELTSLLLDEPDSLTMPRKLKIAFDINEETANYSLVQDLGLITVRKENRRGFKVYLGGSVATNPHKGWLIFDFLEEKDLYRAAKAAKNFFNLYGDREHRNKARIRYIFYKYGEEEAKNLYYKEYDKLLEDKTLDFKAKHLQFEYRKPTFAPESDGDSDFRIWKKRYTEKQTLGFNNYWSVLIPVVNGNIQHDVLTKIALLMEQFGTDVIRLTSRQSIQLRNIPEEYLPNVYYYFKNLDFSLGLPVIINNISACTGAATCRLGICQPAGLSKAIIRQLKKSNLNLDEIPFFKININGCLNSCAQNAWADLGFSGRMGRFNNRSYPAYNIWARTKGEHELAENLGYLPARIIPLFIEKLLSHYLEHKYEYASYADFIVKNGTETITKLIDELKEVPDFDEDVNYYVDWGAGKIFGTK